MRGKVNILDPISPTEKSMPIRNRGVIAEIRKSKLLPPVRPAPPLDIDAIQAVLTKSKELGRQRLAVALAGKRKKKIF